MMIIEREMGFTRAEFLRILPSALRNYPYQRDDNLITIFLPATESMVVSAELIVYIQLGEERVRRIASIALPYLLVRFDYMGDDQVAWQLFLKQFDLYYQKGGG